MKNNEIKNNVKKCYRCGSLFYESDGKEIKGMSFCKACLLFYYKSVYDERKKHLKKNFFLYCFPYILLVIGILLYYILLLCGAGLISFIVFNIFSGLSLLNLIITGIMFISNKDILEEVGEPENYLVTFDGTVDNLGNAFLSGKAHKVYSTAQNLSIIGKATKGFFSIILILTFGWAYFSFYLIRLSHAKNKYAKYAKLCEIITSDMVKMTSAMWCEGDLNFKENGLYPAVKDKNGEIFNAENLKYKDVFVKDNYIYVSLLENESKQLSFIKILPGYDNLYIEDKEEYDSLKTYHEQLMVRE